MSSANDFCLNENRSNDKILIKVELTIFKATHSSQTNNHWLAMIFHAMCGSQDKMVGYHCAATIVARSIKMIQETKGRLKQTKCMKFYQFRKKPLSFYSHNITCHGNSFMSANSPPVMRLNS